MIPGLADHEAVTIEGDISTIVDKQKPKKIHLYKKADWDGSKEFMQSLSDEIGNRIPLSGEENENDAKSLWQAFKSQLHLGINKFIPSKIAKMKNLYPWIDADLRRLIRKRKMLQNQKQIEQSIINLSSEYRGGSGKVIGVMLRRS